MSNEESFGRMVRERRRALDLTQEELARRVGCAAVTIRKIEYDEIRPSVQIAERLANLPTGSADARAFTRLMLAGAMAVDLDRAGRIVIPQYLRKFANLSGTVVVAGLYARVELWNQKDWQAYQEKAEGETGDLAAKLTELGV